MPHIHPSYQHSNNNNSNNNHSRSNDTNNRRNVQTTPGEESSKFSNNINTLGLSDTMLFIRNKLAKDKLKQHQASEPFSHKGNNADKLHNAKQGLALRRKVKIVTGKSTTEARCSQYMIILILSFICIFNNSYYYFSVIL